VNTLEAEIVIDYDNGEIAKAVTKAVSPDNLKTPQGLFVQTRWREGKVFTRIECKTKLSTFIATIDDLLFYTSIAEKAIRATKKLK
jgi:tRNA threonylcarbamoyladenosine modification (KEOPS) complex  Pcc1 subunit